MAMYQEIPTEGMVTIVSLLSNRPLEINFNGGAKKIMPRGRITVEAKKCNEDIAKCQIENFLKDWKIRLEIEEVTAPVEKAVSARGGKE